MTLPVPTEQELRAAAAERNRLAREEDRRTFVRGDVVVFGKGQAAWVVGHVDPLDSGNIVIHSDRATRYLRSEDLGRLNVIYPAHLEPNLETPKGRTVANLRKRHRI